MLNSILMFGSTYSKNKKVNIIFATIWLAYMLAVSSMQFGIFTLISIFSFALVFILGIFFKGKYLNKIIAVFSVLIWSIVIDIICFIIYPEFAMGQSMLLYIWNGILFNYKFIFYNLAILSIINIIPIKNRIKLLRRVHV